jgi:DNA-binding NarL/FixJ family response regulator
MTALLPSFWHLIFGLQRLTNATILTSRTWGTEEALEALLRELPQDEGVLVTHLLMQRFRNLRRNRTAKHRHRQHMLSALARDAGRRGAPADPADIALKQERLDELRSQATRHEWHLLEALATGHTLAEVAASRGISVSCCKTQVCRLRKRLAQCAGERRTGSAR